MYNELAKNFCYQFGDFPFKYLEVPLHFKKLRREDIQHIIDMIIKNIAGWLGKHLSYRGKLILLTTCIASIPAYLMSIMKFPKWAIDAITSQMSHFFGGNMGDTHKYHLPNGGLITKRKEFGGMVVPNLREYNMTLPASWGRRFHDGRDSDLKKNHYFSSMPLISPISIGASLGWALLFGKA